MQKKLEYFFFLLVRRSVLLLPLRSVQRIGSSIGYLAYYLIGVRRRVALENLTAAFPEKTQAERIKIAKGAFRNYGIALFEFLWFPRMNDRILNDMVSSPDMDRLRIAAESAGKRGLILMSGHFGNWEFIAFSVARIIGHPFTIIVQTQSNELVDAVINAHRCLFGNKVVPMGISVREILLTLRRGEIVAIAPDQSGPKEGVYVNFFGRMTASHQGPAAFSLKMGADMYYCFLIRQGDGRYVGEFNEVSRANLPDNPQEAIIELTRRHTAILEEYIRRYPDHWQWMHRRWKHTLENIPDEKRQTSEATA